MEVTYSVLGLFFALLPILKSCSALECYVCSNQEQNTGKCGTSIHACDYGEDACMTEIRWGSTPYWSQGSDKQYYVTKSCSNATECERKRKASLHRCHRIWYEDWECFECCKGDRCNYYVTLGSSSVVASVGVLAVGISAALLAR